MNSIEALKSQIARTLAATDVPLAAKIVKNIPLYDCASLAGHLDDPQTLKEELASVLLHGSGAFVLKGAYSDTKIIDEATSAFLAIVENEKSDKGSGADHFAKDGQNDRIWNSLEKLCFQDPDIYLRYHANRWIHLASQAWLGPAFQMTAQVNIVKPGGSAQQGHCDYHLGFMTAEQVRQYPAHIHATSAQLTLQGGIAHCDMPIESGPTKLLPFSQNWQNNYRDFREPEARELFEENFVQVPLEKGDLIFFSPGILHGAGENRTENINRMANLLQVSSAMGRQMETIDRTGMCKSIYPLMLDTCLSNAEINAVIESTAEGYSFPTSLDNNPPVGGLAPQTQQQLVKQALADKWTAPELNAALDLQNSKHAS